MNPPELVWLKRDLRLSDHAPLSEAAARGPCIVLYIYEPEVLGHEDYDARHLHFVNEALANLDDELRVLGGQLVTQVGEAVEVLSKLKAATGFVQMRSHEETGNAVTYARDKRVKSWARSVGVQWTEYRQFGVIRGLKNRDGWAAKWNRFMAQPVVEDPVGFQPVSGPQSAGLLGPQDLDLSDTLHVDSAGAGASQAVAVLDSFLKERGETYQSAMSSPASAWSACSRISAHLAYGTISMKTVSQTLKRRQRALRSLPKSARGSQWLKSVASFDKRLHWHCHFIQKLESQPSIEHQNMAAIYDKLRVGPLDTDRFESWCDGQTGFPMIDACMRSLRATGWLNFRMRAMLVSFASYHLWLDWRPVSRFLARQFVDYEPGIHYSQVQMQSGTTGINSVRIYSPIKQVVDHDPQGEFIKRWVPELAGVPPKFISQPNKMPMDQQHRFGCVIGKNYPAPIVDHFTAVKRAKAQIYALRKSPEARAEAQAVFRKHGSRRGPTNRGTSRRRGP